MSYRHSFFLPPLPKGRGTAFAVEGFQSHKCESPFSLTKTSNFKKTIDKTKNVLYNKYRKRQTKAEES